LTVPSIQVPARRTHPLAYVLAGGLVVGTLDLVFAMTFWAWKADLPAVRILQSVAAGLLGPASFEGGLETAMLGLVVHFMIALAMALAFYLVACRWSLLLRRPTEMGAAYGLLLYGIMNYVVVPLSEASPGSNDPLWIGFSVVVHIVLIGVPIALFVRQGLLQWREA
jgi:hypothetical protein